MLEQSTAQGINDPTQIGMQNNIKGANQQHFVARPVPNSTYQATNSQTSAFNGRGNSYGARTGSLSGASGSAN